MLLWSTGFIAAKFGLPYAPPLTFLLYRFVLVALVMAAGVALTRAPWPPVREGLHAAIAGLLVHGVYLGGVFVALAQGMTAGTAAVLVGLQPLLTVVLARAWLGERVVARQWLGLSLGVVGVAIVVWPKTSFAGSLAGLVASALALVGISVGTLYQKRHCSHVDLRTGAVIQFVTCAVVLAPVALLLEATPVRWTPEFMFALAWSVFVLSVGAISLLFWLLRYGAAAGVARLFFLVPAVTAIEAYVIFGEELLAPAIFGMVLIAFGVALARPGR